MRSASPTPHALRLGAVRLAAGVAFSAGWLAACLAAAGEPRGTAAHEAAPLEQAVKAAYLYNFTKFVSWPADSAPARAPELTIGVLADAALARSVAETVRDKRLDGRPLVVRHFVEADAVEPCAVIFIGSAFADALPRLRIRITGTAALTVSDAPGFADGGGGMIGLFLDDGRVQFTVDDAAARAAGLTVSSKMLRLSRPAHGRACAACAAPRGGER